MAKPENIYMYGSNASHNTKLCIYVLCAMTLKSTWKYHTYIVPEETQVFCDKCMYLNYYERKTNDTKNLIQ